MEDGRMTPSGPAQPSMPLTRRSPRKPALPALTARAHSSIPLTRRSPRKRRARNTPRAPVLALAAITAAAGCQFTPMPDAAEAENTPGWQWSDEQVMETVNAVRAGRSLQPESWPQVSAGNPTRPPARGRT